MTGPLRDDDASTIMHVNMPAAARMEASDLQSRAWHRTGSAWKTGNQ